MIAPTPFRSFIRFITLVLTMLVLTTSRPASAQDPGSTTAAGSRFDRGISLYDEGDFEGALIEFKRAYKLAPNYSVLYNISLTHYQLGNYAKALTTLRKYLEDGGNEISADRRATSEKEIAKMEGRVGTIEVVVNTPGAMVFLDDEEIGTAPLAAPVLVSIGRRKLAASLDGREVTKNIDVGGGDALRVQLEIPTAPAQPVPGPVALPTPGPSPVPTPDPGTESETSYTGVIVAWVATGVLAGATVGFGLAALSASSNLDDLRSTFPSTQEERDDAAAETERLAIVADVLLAATVVMGGISIYLTATNGPDEASSDGVDAELEIGPGGLMLNGSF